MFDVVLAKPYCPYKKKNQTTTKTKKQNQKPTTKKRQTKQQTNKKNHTGKKHGKKPPWTPWNKITITQRNLSTTAAWIQTTYTQWNYNLKL